MVTFEDARKTQCENKQLQKKAFDKRHRVVDLRPLKPDEHVWVTYMNRRGTVKTHMQVPSRSYVIKTQHGDVRRNHLHMNPTPVEPTYDALSPDVDIPIDLGEGVEEPTVVVAPAVGQPQPPEPRRNPTRERKLPVYLSDYNVTM